MRGISIVKQYVGDNVMALAKIRYDHITLDKNGVPIITGTTMKVIELVLAQQAHGWSPAELHFQFPHLSLGQIHSALGYYWDNKEELDADIATRLDKVNQLQANAPTSPLKEKLRKQGLL